MNRESKPVCFVAPMCLRFLRGLLLAVIALTLSSAAYGQSAYQTTILADNPLAYYALNPGADGTNVAPDLTANANDGQALNIVPALGPTPFITNAANFDGTNAAIDLSQGGNAGILNFSGPITLEAWAQPDSSSLFGDILAKGYDASTYDEITIRVNGPYGANYFGSSGSQGVNGGTQTTNWTYIVLSSDGTNTSLYENGLLVGHTGDTTGSIQFSDDWVIGDGSSAGNSRFFDGNITEVALYNYGLSAAQVLNHYYIGVINSPATTSAPLLTSYPQSIATIAGASATFRVSSVSAYPTTNQWYLNGSALSGQTNTTLVVNNVNASVAGSYKVVVGNQIGATNAVAILTLVMPSTITWSGGDNNGIWDLNATTNWLSTANVQTVFTNDDEVIFNDTLGAPINVTVSNTVDPSVLIVDSIVNNYVINGAPITGPGSLNKEGSSLLTIYDGALSGSVTIGGGAIYAGSNSLNAASSITISNGATLDLAGSSLGNGKPVTVAGQGLNGEGALFNSVGDYPGENVDITLAGDTLFGGTARWDLASGAKISGPYNLTVDWFTSGAKYGQWNSVAIGGVAGISVTNGSTLGMTGMDNSLEDPSTVLTVGPYSTNTFYSGGFNGSFHVYGGGLVYLWGAPAPFTGTSVVLEDNAQWISFYNGGVEPVTSAVTLNGVAHIVVGDHFMLYTNVISGPGGFVMDYYNHGMILAAANTYTGPTILNGPEILLTNEGSISDSSLIFFGGNNSTTVYIDATGRADDTFTLAAGQTLAGIGSINGDLTVASGATISPAGTNTTIGITTGSNTVGTLGADNITLGGTTIIKLDGTGTNDLIEAGDSITYGGVLQLANISGAPLAAGNTFQIFSATSYGGSFSSITPAAPGAGLAWDTTQLSGGVIAVIPSAAGSAPTIASVQFSGGNIGFSGSGGPANGTYYVLETTNLLTPAWVPVSTNSYDASGNFTVTIAPAPGAPQEYYKLEQ